MIAGCGHLKQLDISGNQLLDVNFYLSNCLEKIPDVIQVVNCKIANSIEAMALKNLISDNTVSTKLIFNNSEIPTIYVSKLFENIAKTVNLTKVCLTNITPIIESEKLATIIKNLAKLTRLESLKLQKTGVITSISSINELAELISASTSLKSLRLLEESFEGKFSYASKLAGSLASNRTL